MSKEIIIFSENGSILGISKKIFKMLISQGLFSCLDKEPITNVKIIN